MLQDVMKDVVHILTCKVIAATSWSRNDFETEFEKGPFPLKRMSPLYSLKGTSSVILTYKLIVNTYIHSLGSIPRDFESERSLKNHMEIISFILFSVCYPQRSQVTEHQVRQNSWSFSSTGFQSKLVPAQAVSVLDLLLSTKAAALLV